MINSKKNKSANSSVFLIDQFTWDPLRPSSYPGSSQKGALFDEPNVRLSSSIGKMNEEVLKFLERRLGRLHAKLRLGMEAEHKAQIFGQGTNRFHIENFIASDFLIILFLKLTALYARGCRNATQIQIRRNYIRSAHLPTAFNGYAILHLSDLHIDTS